LHCTIAHDGPPDDGEKWRDCLTGHDETAAVTPTLPVAGRDRCRLFLPRSGIILLLPHYASFIWGILIHIKVF
jgi:hypothetical protein